MQNLFTALVFVSLFLVSCSSKPSGSDYIGNWSNPEKGIINISKQTDKLYLVRAKAFGAFKGGFILNEKGHLEGSNHWGDFEIIYDPDTETLISTNSYFGTFSWN